MQSFVLEELGRLVDMLPQTDPRSPDYQMLLRSIECLDAMGQSINDVQQARLLQEAEDSKSLAEDALVEDKVIPFTAPEFPEEPPAVEETSAIEAKTYEASDVRKALVDAKAKGANVKELMQKIAGADNFGAVPAGKYAELMAAIEKVV